MIKKILNSKFKKDLLFSYFSQIITISFSFLQLFLINRYFGVLTLGQLTIIMSTVGVFSALLTARSSEAVTRFFKREELNKNYENAKFVLVLGFSIDFLTAMLLLIVIYISSGFIAEYFLKNKNLQTEIVVYSFITFFVFLRGTLVGYFQAKEMFINIYIIGILETLLRVFILVTFIFLLNKTSLIDIIYAFLVASIISFIYAFYCFIKNYFKEFRNVKLIIDKYILKEYWNFNLKTFISSSLKAGNQNIDNLIIGYFLNANAVGIYQTIKKLLSPIMIVATPFSLIIYPKLIYFFETGQREKMKKIIVKVSLYILAFSIIYILILHNSLDIIFKIMNVIFEKDYNIYFILIAMLTILYSQMWWVRIFSNTVNPTYSIYINIFATIYQLSIVLLVTKFYGLYGMLIALILMNILILVYISRLLTTNLRQGK